MVENCWGSSGYSAETPGMLGFKGLMIQYNTIEHLYRALTKTSLARERVMLHS